MHSISPVGSLKCWLEIHNSRHKQTGSSAELLGQRIGLVLRIHFMEGMTSNRPAKIRHWHQDRLQELVTCQNNFEWLLYFTTQRPK